VTLDEHTRRLSVATSAGAALLMEAVQQLSDANVEVDDIAMHRPSLDDVFLSLTGHAAEEEPPGTEKAA
jgi:ABC-2 type transport system ATP-binding protein